MISNLATHAFHSAFSSLISHVHGRIHNLYAGINNSPPFHSPILDLRCVLISKGLQLRRVQFFLHVFFEWSLDLAVRNILFVRHGVPSTRLSRDFRPLTLIALNMFQRLKRIGYSRSRSSPKKSLKAGELRWSREFPEGRPETTLNLIFKRGHVYGFR